MKVLVVNWRDIKNPEAGGAEIHIDEILKRKPADWEVDFVSASFKNALKTEIINGYRVIRIPNNALFNFTFKGYWKRKLRNVGYDLIIDDVSKIPLATPTYIQDTPILAILHHIHGKSLFKQLPYPMAFYVYHMERFLLRHYRDTDMVVVSDSTKNELVRLYPFHKLTVSYNGIDFENLMNHCPLESHKEPVLLTFGRLKRYKRIDHLILAFRKVLEKIPHARFHIAGKGDDEERLKELVNQQGLSEKVFFHGFVEDQKKYDLLRSSSVFAIASEKEGWGIVVLESNAAGLPSVGYHVEGLRDSIRDGYSGYLVENGNIELLASKMIELLSDSQKRDEMAKNAVTWASRFSWDNTATEFYAMANKVICEFHQSHKRKG